MKSEKVKIVLSIDLEEWWSVESFKGYFNNNQTPDNDRIEDQINSLLDFLLFNNINCHFFILGRVAAKYPDTIRKISQTGHEIGTHGNNHLLVYNQTPREFEIDLKQSVEVIENLIQKKVLSYRAPSYSITEKSLWALPILEKNGIKFDSSIVPTHNSRFGMKQALREPYRIAFENGQEIFELPPNTMKFSSYSLPLSGGFAFRIFPAWYIKVLFKHFSTDTQIQPQIILHNWEFDKNQPRLNVPIKNRLIHYLNLNNVSKKLDIFSHFGEFIKITDVTYSKVLPFDRF